MKPVDHFHFCPKCAQVRSATQSTAAFTCGKCGFHYYFNPATAAAAFVLNPAGEALFICRAKEPAKGKLALPGGFVDEGETAEEAVRREILEEVNLRVASIEYLCSRPNDYHYQDVTYPVLDVFFFGLAQAVSDAMALDGVASYCWLQPALVDPGEIAFPSIRHALSVFLARR